LYFGEIYCFLQGDYSLYIQEKGQSYSILLIFTNGSPADLSLSKAAIRDVDDSPLSIVIVGVGKENNFGGCRQLAKPSEGVRDNVSFVRYQRNKPNEKLAKKALHPIPAQLETYFIGRDIFPDEPEEAEEIPVEPYDEADQVTVPLEINDAGEVTILADVKPPEQKPDHVPKKPGRKQNHGKNKKTRKTRRKNNGTLAQIRKARRAVGQAKRMGRMFQKVGKLF